MNNSHEKSHEEKSHEEKSHEEMSLTILHKYLPDSLVRYAIAPYLAERVWEIWSEEERKNYPSDRIIIRTVGRTIYEKEYPSMKPIRKIRGECTIEYIYNGSRKHDYIIGENLLNEDGALIEHRLRLWNRLTDVSIFLEFDEQDRTDIFLYRTDIFHNILSTEKYIIAVSDIYLVYAFDYNTGRRLWKKEFQYGIESQPLFISDDILAVVDENNSLTTWNARTGEEKVVDNVHPVNNIYKNSNYLVCLCEDSEGPEFLVVRRIDNLECIVKEIWLCREDYGCMMTTEGSVLSEEDKFIRFTNSYHFLEVWDIKKGIRQSKHPLSVETGRTVCHIDITPKGPSGLGGYFSFALCPNRDFYSPEFSWIYVYDIRDDTLKVIHSGNFRTAYPGPWNSVYVTDENNKISFYKQKLVVPVIPYS